MELEYKFEKNSRKQTFQNFVKMSFAIVLKLTGLK